MSLAAVAASGPAHAQLSDWTGAIDDDYHNPANWTGGTPPPDNNTKAANFTTGGAPTVAVNTLTTVNAWTFGGTTSYSITGQAVTFDGAGAGLTNTSTVAQEISNNLGGTGTLNQNGSGTLTLSGNTSFDSGVFIQQGGIIIRNGGTLATNTVVGSFIGLGGGNTATALVTGAGSTWTSDFGIQLGAVGSTGTLTVADGGTVNATLNTVTLEAGSVLNLGNGNLAGAVNTQQITLNGASQIVANFTDTLTLAAPIAGDGSLIKRGTGRLILAGDSTYTGGTSIEAGVLQVGDGATGFIGGDIAISTNALLEIDRPFGTTLQLDGLISGGGNILHSGAGFTSFNSANTYTGATVITNGVLSSTVANAFGINSAVTVQGPGTLDIFGGDTAIGSLSGDGTVTNESTNAFALTVGGNNTSTIFSGVITQTGAGASTALVKVGAGTLILSGANTYIGGTTITGGTLQIGNGGTTGSVIGNIVNNSNLTINRSDDFNFANGIAGTGALNHAGPGTTTLTGVNTYTGATNVIAGTLAAGAVNAFGNGSAVTVGPGATLSLNGFNQTIGSLAGGGSVALGNALLTTGDGTDTTFSGVISGAGSVLKQGTGTMTLTGNNTFGGDLTVNGGGVLLTGNNTLGGSLSVNNASALLTGNNTFGGDLTVNGGGVLLTGNNTVGGSLSVNSASALLTGNNTVGGDLTVNDGSMLLAGDNTFGALNLNGGTVLVTGTSTNSGGTAINAGTLQLGNGGTTGSVQGGIVNNGVLIFQHSNNFTLANAISGAGEVQFNGSGIVTIADTQTYTGITTVNGGGLIVNGSIGASQQLVLGNNTFLGGSGVVPSVVINGALSPGNSIGTITVQGSLTMGAGSVYAVEFNGVSSDSAKVTGTAALAGQVLALPTSSAAFVPNTYTILTAAGGITGTFAGIDRSAIPPAFRVSLFYTATEVLMSLSPALSQLFGLNRNQRAVATGIEAGLEAMDGTPPAGFVTLLNLPGAALPGALTQLSGEVATGAQTAGVQIMNQYLSLLLNPIAEGRGGGVFGPETAAPSGWSLWGAAYGGANRTAGDGTVIGSHDIRPSAYGFAAGADYRPTPGTLLGFSLAGGGTSWSLSGGLGSGRSDVFQTGGYASHRIGAAYISGALAYAWHDGTIDRTVTIAGADRLSGSFRADSIGARLEAGYRFAAGAAGLTPYGAVQGQTFRTAGFRETAVGSAQFALNYADQSSQALRAELGAWADSRLALANGHSLALRGRVAWAHDDVAGARIATAFQALPGSGFTVLGAEAPADLALVSAGAELRLRNGLSIGAKFDGEFGGGSKTYGGAGTVRYAW